MGKLGHMYSKLIGMVFALLLINLGYVHSVHHDSYCKSAGRQQCILRDVAPMHTRCNTYCPTR